MKKVKYPLKKLTKLEGKSLGIDNFPNFSATGNITGMRKIYGENCLLVKCGSYIYNCQTDPTVYNMAH